MYIKARLKFMRKHDCDFWNFLYYKAAYNRFFKYYKLSLIHKVNEMTRKSCFVFFKKKQIKFSTLHGCKRAFSFFNVLLNQRDGKFLHLKKTLNLYKIFKQRGLRYVTYILKKGFYFKHAYKTDILLGVKSAFQLYKPLKENKMRQRKIYFKQITVFYNNFDEKKLKRFSLLGRKGLFGGINYFFLLLESRIDSILLRFNLGSKFFIRQFILAKNVLIENVPINYFNFIVKKYQFVHFIIKKRYVILDMLLKKIKNKIFFVQPPFYMEINYRTLIIIIVPKLLDPTYIAYPFFKANSKLIMGLHTVLWGW